MEVLFDPARQPAPNGAGGGPDPVMDGTQQSFMQDVVQASREVPVLVDFWATWCGPCQMMAPHFAQAATQLEPRLRLLKVDTDAEQALGTRYAIRSIPTLALFKGGREVARQSGAMQAAGIVQWVRAQGA